MNTRLLHLPLTALQRGRYQPRRHFDTKSIEELAESIRTQGLIEPIIVRELADGMYEIIAGERRWRAAMAAQLSSIPCLLGNYSDEQAATLTLVENIQRQELNLIEEAQGYRRLMIEFHFQQDEIATLVSKSRPHVANTLRLLNLCDEVQEKIKTGCLSAGHARLLAGLPVTQQLSLLKDTLKHHWSVRRLESILRELKKPAASLTDNKDSDTLRLEALLAEQMGTPVEITSENGKSGWLKVKFFDNETLTGLLERMGLSYD